MRSHGCTHGQSKGAKTFVDNDTRLRMEGLKTELPPALVPVPTSTAGLPVAMHELSGISVDLSAGRADRHSLHRAAFILIHTI